MIPIIYYVSQKFKIISFYKKLKSIVYYNDKLNNLFLRIIELDAT